MTRSRGRTGRQQSAARRVIASWQHKPARRRAPERDQLAGVDYAERGLLSVLVGEVLEDLLVQMSRCPGCEMILVTQDGPCPGHHALDAPFRRYSELDGYLAAAAGKVWCPLDERQAAAITASIPAALELRRDIPGPVSAALVAAYAELGRQLGLDTGAPQ